MLERLRVQGFQVHEDLDVRIDPQITTIVGETDTGKSSLIRALRWLTLNQPRGDGFINTDMKSSTVKAKLDGQMFKRGKGKKNLYQMGKDKKFYAFGNDVPPEIQESLCISDLNFQMQHDPPFWFSMSAAEVGRQLNKIVDLEQIDKVATKLNGRVRGLKSEVSVVEKRLKQAEQKVEDTEFAIEMDEDLVSLEELQKRIGVGKSKKEVLAKLIVDVSYQEAIRNKAVGIVDDAEVVMEIGSQCEKLSSEISVLKSLVKAAREVESSIVSEPIDLEELEDLCNTRSQIISEREQLISVAELARTEAITCLKKKKELKLAEEELSEKFDGICPTCGSKWDGEI